jgi:hypothetical protein
MGDMIAPYWDDLNLLFNGFIETEEVGQAPERIFVVEWQDVSRYASPDDRLTFEVQLFEGSNDIVFLYRETQTVEGANGGQATIGLQSEGQGYALQVSCNQIAVYNNSAIQFAHPEQEGDQASAADRGQTPVAASLKGPAAELVQALDSRGRSGLANLRTAWLNRRPPLAVDWRWADVDGDREQEAVVLWWGDAGRPELVQIVVAEPGDYGHWQLAWQTWPLARQERLGRLALAAQGDVTGDGAEEIILRDPRSGSLTALMASPKGYELVDLPGRCSGSLLLGDHNDDGVQEIYLGGCPGGGRRSIHWDGQAFVAGSDR